MTPARHGTAHTGGSSIAPPSPLPTHRFEDHTAVLATALHDTYIGVARILGKLIEAKDPHTRHHLDRVYTYATALTRAVDPDLAAQPQIGYGYLLHDIGKLGVPDRVLTKPGPLNPDERRLIEAHPVLGAELVSPLVVLGDAVKIVRHHHERWDGHGYPDGLAHPHGLRKPGPSGPGGISPVFARPSLAADVVLEHVQ